MSAADYQVAWVVYGVAGIVWSFLVWKLLRRFLYREVAYLFFFVMLALIFTPWYVVDDPAQPVMAPALMVFVMDSITINPKAGIRALTPLVLALGAALLVAAGFIVYYRYRLKRQVQEQ